MQNLLRGITLMLLLLVGTATVTAQCTTWNDSPKKEDAENAHVAYRNFVKGKTAEQMQAMGEQEFQAAFDNWQTAYEIAPAADGQRPFHYRDGRKFYKALHAKATDDAKKAEYIDAVMRLYEEELECYPKNKAFLLGRQASDMFYLKGYSMEGIDVLEEAMKAGGDKTEYIVFVPLGKQLNYYFGEEAIDNGRVRELYDMARDISAANTVETNQTYGQYYQDAFANLEADVLAYADQIFDCDYFKELLMPKYEDNKDDLEVLRYIVNKLEDQGCDVSDPDVAKVQATYDALYASLAAEREEELLRRNPGLAAARAAKEGRFQEAVDLYKKAAEKTDDVSKRSNYLYRAAAVTMSELNQYGTAKGLAREAAAADPSNGRPYLLIGDIYARLGSSCGGDSYQQRLAVLAAIDKYSQARRVDSDVAGDASRRIGRLSGSMPIRSEAFQRGHKEGERLTVGCGINETVTLRF